ncbi:acyltransferase family protein [Corticibacterium sp. UT-5YL-CI-8]|nr:acyltransferase family protein [Tianweitania sp. UT-5YL-CI-8]
MTAWTGSRSTGHSRVAANVAQIDGLRGIAVAAVVLYHFTQSLAPGGFVGVDIFFVLSGFLIGGILWRELSAHGSINVGNFLVRRLKRLAPAYFAMALATTIVAYLILLPFEFREYSKSLIASVVYLSNVQFFREAGYFDIASENKILLHTWSLAVEEQFYLFLPLVLLILRRRRLVLAGVLATICATSLLACIIFTPISPTATFFLFPFRAWELLLGVVLAIAWTEWRLNGSYGQWLSWLGLGLVAAAIGFTRPEYNFPGAWALLPTVGTAMLLLNINDRNPVNAILGWQPLVHLGLISYSLYLWHWPVLTLSTYYQGGQSGGTVGLWLAIALVLAILSWRFVERPVREAQSLPSFALVSGVGLGSATLLLVGAFIFRGDGLPERFGPAARMHIQASADFIQDWSRCTTPDSGSFAGVEICKIGVEGEPSFIVWGDSHGRAMKEGIELAATEAKSAGLLIWRAGCPPLFDIDKQENAATPAQNASCALSNASIRKTLPQLRGIERILLVGRWSYYADGRGSGVDARNEIVLKPQSGQGHEAQAALFFDAAVASAKEIGHAIPKVFVLQQPPEISGYDSREASRLLALGGNLDPLSLIEPVSEVEARAARGEAPFLKLARDGRITYLKLRDRFCEGQVCSAVHNGLSYYFDNNHITNSASKAIRSVFTRVVAPHVGEVVVMHEAP